MLTRFAAGLSALACAGAAAAAAAGPTVQSQSSALASDAALYAGRYGVSIREAERRLRAQQASVAATDAIRAEFAGRLAGISIDHRPLFQIRVALAGPDAVEPRTIMAGGMRIPVVFRNGLQSTHDQAVAAMRRHLIDLRAALPGARGAGYDQRTGEVVLLVRQSDADRFGLRAIESRAEQASGVAVRVVINELLESNMVEGGGRIDGIDTVTRRRNVCTTGFVVTDGGRKAVVTAAHCPDEVTYRSGTGADVALPFAGQWGLGYHDVQINLVPSDARPLFFADRPRRLLRRLSSWRNRASTRAGDFVCHYGETTGYSCGEVEFTDYAPPGALCGGPCSPTWVTVRNSACAPGDSGGPVFSGTVAFGIAKGINRSSSGRCNFYYYMSVDYLPAPWSLLHRGSGEPRD